MKCENSKCDVDHDGSFGSGRFCSRPCANRRSRSKETKAKISYSVKVAILENRLSPPPRPQIHYTAEDYQRIFANRKRKRDEDLMLAEYSSLTYQRLRERICLEQDGKCNNCGLSEWFDKPLSLELEHKDGDRHNNDRENLEMLCPNCHALTDTWRGRNKERIVRPAGYVSQQDMVKAYLETGNIRQCLLKLGLAPKGNNYGRVKRTLTIWGIKY